MGARFVIAAAALLAAGLGPASAQVDASRIELGARIARESCASCHAIDAQPDKQTASAAPSFSALAAMPAMSELAIRVFLQTPHASMPNIMLLQNEIDALAAYIVNLRGK